MSIDRSGARPNVLTIMCDQLRYDVFSHMGHAGIQTPNLDRLAREGVDFTEATCAAPLCGPSRAAILTGRYSYDGDYAPRNAEPHAPSLFLHDVRTIDEILSDAGYHVEYHGKWHVGNGHRQCYRGDNVVFGHDMRVYHDYLAKLYDWPGKTDRKYRVESYSY